MPANSHSYIRNTVFLGTFVALSCQAVIFEDGTFDDPSLSFSDGVGWEGSGVSIEDWANGAPGTGGSFGYAGVDDNQSGIAFRAFSETAGSFYHDVPVESGRQYEFHIQSHTALQFYNQIVGAGTGTVTINFAWYDVDPGAGASPIAGVINDITSLLTNGGGDGEFPAGPSRADRWQDWDYSLTAPAGAAFLRATIEWTAAATVTGGDEVMRWDNAELTTTLDPINENQQQGPVVQLAIPTQATVTHTVEVAEDLNDSVGWDASDLPPLVGDDTTQSIHVVPEGSEKYFRVKNER